MMEKSTEPNESKQEEGINEASEIITSQEEQVQTMGPQTVPEVKPIKTQLNFDTLELEAYVDIFKKMIYANDWSKKEKKFKKLSTNLITVLEKSLRRREKNILM